MEAEGGIYRVVFCAERLYSNKYLNGAVLGAAVSSVAFYGTGGNPLAGD